MVFLVYLYQKYKYKVDYSRVNEFGVSGDDLKQSKEEKPIENKEIKSIEANETKKDK